MFAADSSRSTAEKLGSLKYLAGEGEETPHRSIFRYLFRGSGVDTIERSEVDNTAADADGDGLGAIASPEFFHDVLDVDLDGFLGDE